ncbi:MAG: hypothetical protein H6617_10265 [Bdellovibrionaceae bacterium]|nr:hypothetical protein [Bdellovibrionales bacterium]MCB9255055.1 hypothetical protein [Pseudobdellovibrionaceae bacterium]
MNQPSVNSDKFQVLRTLVAISHLDGQSCALERRYLFGIAKKLNLSAHQQRQLMEELDEPKDPLALFAQIQSPKERGWLLTSARTLAHADGIFSSSEQIMLDQMFELHMSTIDIDAVIAAVMRDE